MNETLFDRRKNVTTYESLLAFVVLLYTENKKEFEEAYRCATHDRNGNGKSVWYWIHKYSRCNKGYNGASR